MRMRAAGAVIVAMLLLGACASSSSTPNPVAASPPSTSSSTFSSTGSATGSPVTGGGAAIAIAPSPYGEMLTADGATVYVLTSDPSGASACTDDCAVTWPPVPGDAGFDADPAVADLLGVITRDDGTEQLAIDGRPLYTYSGDGGPGDTNGQGLNDVWFVVSPAGEPLQDDTTRPGY